MRICRALPLVILVVAMPLAASAQFGGMPGLPGGTPGGVPGVGGLDGPPAGPPPACRDLLAMRDDVQKHGVAIRKANERKATVQEACVQCGGPGSQARGSGPMGCAAGLSETRAVRDPRGKLHSLWEHRRLRAARRASAGPPIVACSTQHALSPCPDCTGCGECAPQAPCIPRRSAART